MAAQMIKISVPTSRKSLPREITPAELSALTAVADLLCGPSDIAAAPSAQPDFPEWLNVALAARSDVFEEVIAQAIAISAESDGFASLKSLSASNPEAFHGLSSVVAGAYLMVPAVKQAVAYPGQTRDPAGLEEAVDEIADGILDPVLERGSFFIPTPEA